LTLKNLPAEILPVFFSQKSFGGKKSNRLKIIITKKPPGIFLIVIGILHINYARKIKNGEKK